MRDRKPGNCSCACKGATLQLVPHFLSVETENPATGQPIRLPLALHAQQSITGNWVQAPAMKASRTGASAARVADGRVLIRGSAGVDGPLAITELYANGSWTRAATTAVSRTEHHGNIQSH